MVVVANLGGILLALQSELLAHKAVAKGLPIVVGISHMVGIVVAGGATKLGGEFAGTKGGQLLLKTVDEDHNLLAQACGRSGLAVGLGEHGHVAPLVGILLQLVNDFFYLGAEDLVERVLHREGHAGIVDILRGKTKVDKLLVGIQTAYLVKLFLDEILDGLDVMVGYHLDILHALGVGLRERQVYLAQAGKQCMVKRRQLGQGQLAQGNEVLDFHTDAILDKCILRKILGQSLCLPSITAIYRRNGGQQIQIHILCFIYCPQN